MDKKLKVFVNYHRYGRENIFMDFDSLPLFTNFEEFIRQTVRDVDVVAMMIGPRWTELVVIMAWIVALIVSRGNLSPSTAGNPTNTPPHATTVAPTITPTPLPAGTTRTDSHGMVLVWVPAGCFQMGSDPVKDSSASGDEQPQHQVCITQGYWIGKFDVTNAQFNAYVKAAGVSHIPSSDCRVSSQPDQPVICVTWYEAVAYAKWMGGRLPTEAEWEYAARGPQSPIYPWGDTFDSNKANTSEGKRHITTRVGSYPTGASWVGAQDMAGNVWQWVADWYSDSYYQNSPKNDPPGSASGPYRVVRGGSCDYPQDLARAANRNHFNDPGYRYDPIGFRVVVSFPAQ